MRPGGLAAEAFRVVPGGDQEQRGSVGADAIQSEQAGRPGRHERDDERIEARELAIEELGASSQFPQGDPGGVADGVAGAGPQRRQLGDQVSGGVPGEAGPQVIGAGQDQGPGLVDRLGPAPSGRCVW